MIYRFLGLEIITIREAAWLTDNTYKYEDVVRMMGEVTACLNGKFRVRSWLCLQVTFISLALKNICLWLHYTKNGVNQQENNSSPLKILSVSGKSERLFVFSV